MKGLILSKITYSEVSYCKPCPWLYYPCTTHALHRPKGIKRPTSMAFYRGWKGLAAKGVFQIRHPHLIGKLGPKRPTVISVWMTRVKSKQSVISFGRHKWKTPSWHRIYHADSITSLASRHGGPQRPTCILRAKGEQRNSNPSVQFAHLTHNRRQDCRTKN